jgi:integrase
MAAMPRPRPPYLQRHVNRHGKAVWYVHKRPGAKIRIRAEFDTPEFLAEYQMAVTGAETVTTPARTSNATLSWLLDRYRDTSAWRDLSDATRRQRENIFKGVLASAGNDPYAAVTRATITAGRDRRAATPAQARNFLDALRGLFRWALEADLMKFDPTAGVRNPKRTKGAGFPIWTEEEVDHYHAHWPIGTMQRVWIDVLLYTGLRRGDAVMIGRQHVRDGVLTFRTEKSGEMVTVTIPILPVLQTTLDAGPTGELSFICGARRKPLVKEAFGTMFKEACVAAGVTEKSAHGLRKIGATRAANNGASERELDALFGWIGGGMAQHYTRAADRARLGKQAGQLLEKNAERTSYAPTNGLVGAQMQKSKQKQ